ncbi:MAG: hypothetical protein COA66_05965 [Arcobacter sp.]|nr:MAG: hypothetical protein COA66_05965 [Arcobacter sp.]
MNKDNDYIEDMKYCITINSVGSLMNEKPYPTLEKSNFQDNHVLLPKSSKALNRMDFRLENTFLELVLRLMVFLKLDGMLGYRPIGSGKITYAQEVRYILRKIQEIQPTIRSFNELRSETIDVVIDEYYNEENRKEKTSVYQKLHKIIEFAKYGNDFLPSFLQLDISIILNSKKYEKVKNDYRMESKAKEERGSDRKPYNLVKLKTLVGYAIEYLEKNSEDCLLATKIYIDAKNTNTRGNSRHTHAHKAIKNNSYRFSEPKLSEIQKEISLSNTLYISVNRKKKGLSVERIISSLLDSSKKLEACCIIILLMTTGMRKSEAILLPRYPIISDDDYSNLKRIVYKTARTDEGFEHSMPIPKITKKAIEILSRISEIKDGKSKGNLIIGSPEGDVNADPSQRIQYLINRLCEDIGIKDPPIPHQFRHAIAFLIASINQKNGLELARLFLGHTSITMTLQYMGHYNLMLKKSINELHAKESEHLIGEIINEIKDGRNLYGKKGERLTANYQFKGSYSEEFTDLLNTSLLELIKKGKLAIIQTPVSLCMHDLTKPEEMVCQRGFHINNFIGENPKPSRCEAENCTNAVFTESHVEKLRVGTIDKKLKKRLEKNRFFVESGGFEEDPFSKIISKYENDKKLREVV